MMRAQNLVSAGGVVCRFQGDQVEVLLCGRFQPLLWALPKGGPNPSETLEEAALREVEEETGLKASIVTELGKITYWFVSDGTRYHKIVHFYLMRPEGGSLESQEPEFDMVRWYPSQEACNAMTYPNEKAMVLKALEIIKSSEASQHDIHQGQ